ncbi:MAG: flavodoxin domain-containing protein [Methanomicrobiaceae archaeon]|nr:flavodoxin domain-containing protein [Methanomicrobiaceae archaeon]
MPESVLIAYATKHNTTKEIAEAISKTLNAAGLTAEALPAKEAGDVASYHAVIIGSPIYAGRIIKDAAIFAEKNAKDLEARTVFAFTVELGVAERSEENIKKADAALAPIRNAVSLAGVEHFAGRFDPSYFPVIGFLMKLGGKNYEDHRDWDRIREWAENIAADLGSSSPAPAEPDTAP